jgi:hypothetical protein
LQVACFFLDQVNVHAVAFRYESDEAPAPDGTPRMHGYVHAQPSNAIRCRQHVLPLPTSVPAVPDQQPAIPLPAKTPADLLACVLVSLCGRRQAEKLLGATAPLLLPRLKLMLGL